MASATSSVRSSPESRYPLASTWTSARSSSCSSVTSPRISSMRSSVVTMPAVPPYSSITTQTSMPSARICSINASPSRVVGTVGTERAIDERDVESCSSGATVNACLMWTTPIMSSRSPSLTIGKRECPVRDVAMTRSRIVSSRSRYSTVTRGVIRSSAVSSPNLSDRSTSIAVSGSIDPCLAELRTSEPNSDGDRADRSSSAGSIPIRRTIQFAAPLRPRMTQRNASEK